MKRQRGRGRKPGGGGGGGGNNGNRSLESNGPEVKIRGTAAQIFEKYAQYARDAQSGGDRVKYENYLQHAEHYYRIMAATMPRDQRIQQSENGGGYGNTDDDRDGDETSADSLKVVDQSGDAAGSDDDGAEDGDGEGRQEPGAEFAGNVESSAQGGEERGEGRSRRRRNRNRHRDGANAGGNGDGASDGDPEARSALDALAQKQAAVAGG